MPSAILRQLSDLIKMEGITNESPNFLNALGMSFAIPQPGFSFHKQNSLQRIDSFGRILADSITGDPDILFSSTSPQVSIKKEPELDSKRNIYNIGVSHEPRPSTPSSPFRQDSEVPGDLREFDSGFNPGTPILVPGNQIKEDGMKNYDNDTIMADTLNFSQKSSNLAKQESQNSTKPKDQAESVDLVKQSKIITMKRTSKTPSSKIMIPQHLRRPEYKYPPYNQKKQPTRDMKMFKNDEHFNEAVKEWKRKRALNNRSVRLCRERKQREFKDLEEKCSTLELKNKGLKKDISDISKDNDILLAAILNRKALSSSEELHVRRLIAQFKKNKGRQ